MVREYGEQLTANLVTMGITCAADVTPDDLQTARKMQTLPGIGNADEPENNEGNFELAEVMPTVMDSGLDLNIEEGLTTANLLSKRVVKNVEMVHTVYRQTLSAAVCLGFVLIDLKMHNQGKFMKFFRQGDDTKTKRETISQSGFPHNGKGCFGFSKQMARRYMKLANYTAQQAEEKGLSAELLRQVRAYIHTGISAELDCLPEILPAETLRQALMECGAIPRPLPKSLPQPAEPEPVNSAVLTPEEEDETAWYHASQLISGFRRVISEEVMKMNRDRRRVLRDYLEELIHDLDAVGC